MPRRDPSDPFPPCWHCGSSDHMTADHCEHVVWSKQSHRRHSAKIGPLTIDVKLVGIGDKKHWVAGEIFGQHHHGARRDTSFTLEEAQRDAERVARKLLKEASKFLFSFREASEAALGRR